MRENRLSNKMKRGLLTVIEVYFSGTVISKKFKQICWRKLERKIDDLCLTKFDMSALR